MKNKKRIYQGYNRKQIKKVAVWLQQTVNSLRKQLEEAKRTNRVLYTQLEEEKVRHKEYKDLCVAYTSRNLDLVQAHDQEVLRHKRELERVKNELTATKYCNEKLSEQLEHFTEEVQLLEIEIAEIRSRNLIQRILNK